MNAGQMYYKEQGMNRSVVIYNSDITSMQFKIIARKTGIHSGERYINANENKNWEQDGLNWIEIGIETKVNKESEISTK